jgi:hypothetical protein
MKTVASRRTVSATPSMTLACRMMSGRDAAAAVGADCPPATQAAVRSMAAAARAALRMIGGITGLTWGMPNLFRYRSERKASHPPERPTRYANNQRSCPGPTMRSFQEASGRGSAATTIYSSPASIRSGAPLLAAFAHVDDRPTGDVPSCLGRVVPASHGRHARGSPLATSNLGPPTGPGEPP